MHLRKQESWRGNYLGLEVHIVRWEIGHPIWNYYVYLPESLLGEKFKEIWLEPKLIKITPESKGFVTYEYEKVPYINVESWHGGITFYKKHGEMEGHRVIEVGCDYNHLWDRESGYSDTLESVTFDCKKTIEELLEAFGLSKDNQVKNSI